MAAALSPDAPSRSSRRTALNSLDEELCALLLGFLGAGHAVAFCLGGHKDLVVVAALHAVLHPWELQTWRYSQDIHCSTPL